MKNNKQQLQQHQTSWGYRHDRRVSGFSGALFVTHDSADTVSVSSEMKEL